MKEGFEEAVAGILKEQEGLRELAAREAGCSTTSVPNEQRTAYSCDKCGAELRVGDWPFCPHGTPSAGMQSGFGAYFDYGLGCEITSAGQRRQLMRQGTTVKGHFHKLDWKGRKVGMPGCEV